MDEGSLVVDSLHRAVYLGAMRRRTLLQLTTASLGLMFPSLAKAEGSGPRDPREAIPTLLRSVLTTVQYLGGRDACRVWSHIGMTPTSYVKGFEVIPLKPKKYGLCQQISTLEVQDIEDDPWAWMFSTPEMTVKVASCLELAGDWKTFESKYVPYLETLSLS